MNHALLKSVIYDQHEFIRNFQIVPRDYEFEGNGNYVLVGLRRAGKSTLLYKIVLDLVASGVDWEQIIYINFEDERLSEFTVADFNDLLSVQSEMSDKKGYFFLDEVQNIDGWEKFARRMADAKEHIYITGSNAKMLSREIETTLGGRFFAKHITPYAFGEYLTACEVPHDEPALLGTKTNGRSAPPARSIYNTAACRNRCCTRQNGSIFPAFTKKCCWATSSRGTASATTMR